jgi:hypothetical protein
MASAPPASPHQEFEQTLAKALADSQQLYVLNVLLDPADRSPGMIRLAHRLAKGLSTDRLFHLSTVSDVRGEGFFHHSL